MLISCPKCQSIYEIPDDLIGKTGQNFRCQTCAHVWHAMREDALGYAEEDQEEPYIEAITLQADDKRNYPANKLVYTMPTSGKSGKKTRSSKDILAKEGDTSYNPVITPKKQIVLTSDNGASFTITPPPAYEKEEIQESLHLTINPEDIRIKAEDRLLPEKPFKGYRKTKMLLWFVAVFATLLLLRRDIVAFIPTTETYYNKIHLTGLNNPEYLKFGKITTAETIENGTKGLKLTAEIKNESRFTTRVPEVKIGKEKISPAHNLLKARETTRVETFIPFTAETNPLNLTLSFANP